MTMFCVVRTIDVFRDIPERKTIALRLAGEKLINGLFVLR